jgi:hypothetical protein
MGPGWSTAVDTIEEGTIVVDLIDRAKKSVVWRGTGVRTLDRNMTDPELKETVDTILDHFPSVTAPHEPSSTP